MSVTSPDHIIAPLDARADASGDASEGVFESAPEDAFESVQGEGSVDLPEDAFESASERTPDGAQGGVPEAEAVLEAADTARTDESKADEPKADAVKADEVKAEEAKTDAAKADASKADESEADASKADESEADAVKSGESEADAPQTGAASASATSEAGAPRADKPAEPPAPAPRDTFAALGLSGPVVAALTRNGVITPFPIQAATIPDALAGKDVLGRGRTGSGKTLSFGLPLLATLAGGHTGKKRPRGLILTPTRELAMQVADALQPYGDVLGLRMKVVCGGTSMANQIYALERGVDILVATPGRLRDVIKRGACALDRVQIAVLDEADQMADMGFLPEVTELLDQVPGGGQRMLFSATLDNDIDTLIKRYLNAPVTHEVDPSAGAVSTMTHHILIVKPRDKAPVTAAIAARKGRTIVFVRTQMGADRVAAQLRDASVRAEALHGGMTQGARTRTLADFKDGYVSVLVATDVAARGIHVDGIDLVLNVDPAGDHKDYLHRSGRTARAGRSGTVVSLALPHQRRQTFRLMEDAGVRAARHIVGSGGTFDPEVAEITGARSMTEVQAESAARAAQQAEREVKDLTKQLERAERRAAELRDEADQLALRVARERGVPAARSAPSEGSSAPSAQSVPSPAGATAAVGSGQGVFTSSKSSNPSNPSKPSNASESPESPSRPDSAAPVTEPVTAVPAADVAVREDDGRTGDGALAPSSATAGEIAAVAEADERGKGAAASLDSGAATAASGGPETAATFADVTTADASGAEATAGTAPESAAAQAAEPASVPSQPGAPDAERSDLAAGSAGPEGSDGTGSSEHDGHSGHSGHGRRDARSDRGEHGGHGDRSDRGERGFRSERPSYRSSNERRPYDRGAGRTSYAGRPADRSSSDRSSSDRPSSNRWSNDRSSDRPSYDRSSADRRDRGDDRERQDFGRDRYRDRDRDRYADRDRDRGGRPYERREERGGFRRHDGAGFRRDDRGGRPFDRREGDRDRGDRPFGRPFDRREGDRERGGRPFERRAERGGFGRDGDRDRDRAGFSQYRDRDRNRDQDRDRPGFNRDRTDRGDRGAFRPDGRGGEHRGDRPFNRDRRPDRPGGFRSGGHDRPGAGRDDRRDGRPERGSGGDNTTGSYRRREDKPRWKRGN